MAGEESRIKIEVLTPPGVPVTADITKWGGTAQTGLDVGTELPQKVNKATTPAIYNVAITDGSTEYSQAMPATTKKFLVHCRDGTEFRLAFVTGKVAVPNEPYLTVRANSSYNDDLIEPATLTLFLACAGGAGINKKIEIVAWS
jgi:hypothetical protein